MVPQEIRKYPIVIHVKTGIREKQSRHGGIDGLADFLRECFRTKKAPRSDLRCFSFPLKTNLPLL